MALIVVASFSKPEEAHLLRLRLEAGGVPAHVQDENAAHKGWMLSLANGGVRVMIEEEDAERAREILAEEPAAPLTEDRPACPGCFSGNTVPGETPRRFGFLPPRPRWTCADCGRSWEERVPG